MHWINADIDSRVFGAFLQRARDGGFLERVSAVHADARALPVQEAFADIIVSRGSFPFWRNKPAPAPGRHADLLLPLCRLSG